MGTNDLLRGHLDRLLLAALADAPGHGYELAQRLAARTAGTLDVPEGSLYPALHRLEGAGLVTSEWKAIDGRRRRVYASTAKGRRQLVHWRKEWRTFAMAVDGVLGALA
jgi:DNA-binding PadR family transcriptional regulator